MEIEKILLKFGAKGIYKEFQGSRISSLMFYLEKDNQKIPFKIPVSIDKSRAIMQRIVNEGKLPKKFLTEPLRTEQGERVTWRVIKDWIDSQLSLLEMQFADAIEILLPYAYDVANNKTVYQKFLENKERFISLEYKEADKRDD